MSLDFKGLAKKAKESPKWWVNNIVGNQIWSKQIEIMESVRDNPFTTVKSCNGAGKSFISAHVVAWFLTNFPESIVITTAPTTRQVEEILWQEIARVHAKSKFPLGGRMLKTKWDFEAKWYALGLSTTEPDKFQGFHAPHILAVVDEACHSADTEILTKRGWVLFPEVKPDDEVLSMNPETFEADYYPIDRVIAKPYKGKMYEYDSPTRPAQVCVTPDHMMFLKPNPQTKDWRFETFESATHYVEFNIPKHFVWKGQEQEYFTLPEIPSSRKPCPERKIKMDDWLEFLGWYASEGSVGKSRGLPQQVIISQSVVNESNRAEIVEVITRMGDTPRIYDKDIRLGSRQLAEHLVSYGKALTKQLPDYLRHLSPRQITIFLDAFTKGDGYSKTDSRDILYTSSKPMADMLQELVLKSGYDSTITVRKLKGDRKWVKDHYAVTSVDAYAVSKGRTNAGLKIRQRNIKEIDYDGMVYCVTVAPHHLIYTRRNGACVWTGNCGVESPIFEGINSIATSDGARVLYIGNPTEPEGDFYKSFSSPLYNKIHISAFDTPNFTNELGYRVPGLSTPEWVEQRKAEWGEDSPAYIARVLGEFPDVSMSTMLPLSWLMKATLLDLKPQDTPRVLGVDPARYGDDETVIARRSGNEVVGIKRFNKLDTVEVAREVEEDYKSFPGCELIVVDAVGLGSGVADNLRHWGYPVVSVESAERAYQATRFNNKRTEMWGRLRELLRTNSIKLPNDEAMIGQLSSPRYSYDAANRQCLETKDDMKKRGLRSPNIADAVVYAFAYDGKYHSYIMEDQGKRELENKNTVNYLLKRLRLEMERKRDVWY